MVCPPHVEAEKPLQFDGRFFNGLLRSTPRAPWLAEAVDLYHLSNTDSSDVQPHTEVVLAVAALQRALNAEHLFREPEIANAFVTALSPIPHARTVAACRRRFEKGARPPGQTLRELWFRDLYRLRNAFAHGETRPVRRRGWTAEEHLCLTSYILPRLVMVRLSELGTYELSDTDRDEIGAFDCLLCLRTFKQGTKGRQRAQWPWSECYFSATNELATERSIAEFLKEHPEFD